MTQGTTVANFETGDTPPKILWHYTDAAGVSGILTTRSLRFGNARFLNDQTEYAYGWDVIRESLSRAAEPGSPLDQFFVLVVSIAEASAFADELFLCSFSERADSISQWQRYGADGFGYCLGFAGSLFNRSAASAGAIVLRRMVYDRDEQKHAVQRYASEVAVSFEKVNTRETRKSLAHQWGLRFAQLCLTFKNPQFADELEWRAVAFMRTDTLTSDVRFIARHNYVRPYLEVSLPRDNPLNAVVCGPKLEPLLAESSVEYLLRLTGSERTEVRMSDLRGTWR